MLDAPSIERQLATVMAEYPDLSDHGIGMFDGHKKKAPEERSEIHRRERGALRCSVADVAWTVEWLRSNIEPRKTINRRHSSYGLKSIAERHSPNLYLSNGVFIAAALIVGYPVQFNGTANPWFGMSEKSIKAVRTSTMGTAISVPPNSAYRRTRRQ